MRLTEFITPHARFIPHVTKSRNCYMRSREGAPIIVVNVCLTDFGGFLRNFVEFCGILRRQEIAEVGGQQYEVWRGVETRAKLNLEDPNVH